MPFENRYPHHLIQDDNDYASQYGYDIEHLAEWSQENDPDFISMQDLLSYTLNVYGHIVSAALTLEVPSVLDIGCGCAQQSKMFAESDIDYIGLEPWEGFAFYGQDRPGCSLIRASYPECGNLGQHAAVSSHCVGTNLLWEPEAIADDFDVFIGHCFQEFFDVLSPLYDNFEVIEAENFAFHPEIPRTPMMIAACWR